MPEHPHPSIWERLRAQIAADPTPGEQRLAGAVQHAQAEPERPRRGRRTDELSDHELSEMEEAAAAMRAEVDPDEVDRRW